MDDRLQQIGNLFFALPQVKAVTLAGSRTLPHADPASDYDIYVYVAEDIPVEEREKIIMPRAEKAEINNQFWETGDEWLELSDGLKFDVMYRWCDWVEAQITRVMTAHQASVGYSTALLHNIIHSQILFDRDGWFAKLQSRANQSYPDGLQRAIIAKNHPILRGKLSSYIKQIEIAIKRDDAISVNHRVSALLASYFDILFAINKVPHPGEKRQLIYSQTLCPKRPQNMEAHIAHILQQTRAPSEALIDIIHTLLNALDTLLIDENLI